ncbi:MAG: type I restriction endonuclease subunit R [Methanobacteriaceae archaeon]
MKILAGYHQYFAVNKAVKTTIDAVDGDGKAGVFWHTQGSGKSLSMIFYVHLLGKILNSPTFLLLTDRNDLDQQLFSQFSKSSNFLKQVPKKAKSRANLKELLINREANGIIFSTMQKFEESDEPLSNRNDIIVISDEAHRSQYGLNETVNLETGKVTVGNARKIRDALPNASFIGFTGTPISSNDKNTREVFGDYIDIYDMTQSVEDGATRPIHYESRVIKLNLDENILNKIDKEYDILALKSEAHIIEKSKSQLSKMESLLGAPETIDSLAKDIIEHYENNREFELTGKAMIVAYSRNIAMKIYKKILEIRPMWDDKVKVVMTSNNNDPEEWHDIIGNKSYKNELANKFKDDNDPMKIAIVVDMWLTGFDIPSLATMYIFKPMKGHNLMQAIARVNRVFKNKEGGLIVDYIGISSALRKAMNDYTGRDKDNFIDMDISKIAYPKFQEKLSICQDFLHGFDYSKFFEDSDLLRAKTISGGVNFLSAISREAKKEDFIKESLLLRQALSLCKSIATEKERFEAAYFEAVRTILTRVESDGKLSLKEINSQINELLKQSIKSEGVINLFSDVKEEFSLFDPDFLEEISKIQEKNLAVEILKKLLNEQVSIYKRTNLVKSEQFSDIIKRTMNNYINGLISNEEVISELLEIAKEIRSAKEEGDDLGLNSEELAFYDALTKPEAINDFYENQELIDITRELTDLLRKNRVIDWQKKTSARAKMRFIVKKLLKKHKYPPEGLEDAISTVIKQCELWADN